MTTRTKSKTQKRREVLTAHDGYYRPTTREREWLRAQVLKHPEQFRAEIDQTGGTNRQQAKRKYLKRLIANLRPNVMRQWYGSVDGPAPVTQRAMTNEERARYFPESLS